MENYVNKSMKFVYKGFICKLRDTNEVSLAVCVNKKTFFTKLADPYETYKDLKVSSAKICLVEFKDGIDPIDIDSALNVDHSNVFPWILNIGDIESKYNDYLFYGLKDNPKETLSLWKIIDEVLLDNRTIKEIKKHKKITKKWVETH